MARNKYDIKVTYKNPEGVVVVKEIEDCAEYSFVAGNSFFYCKEKKSTPEEIKAESRCLCEGLWIPIKDIISLENKQRIIFENKKEMTEFIKGN